MLEAIFVFVIMMSCFEFAVISMIAPRWRLRLLGSRRLRITMHFFFLIANLIVHWGTVTGTMAATGAFAISMATCFVARLVYGEITNDVRVRRGLVGFTNQELMR